MVLGNTWSLSYFDEMWVNQNNTVKQMWQNVRNDRHGVTVGAANNDEPLAVPLN
jgi:hypothetical protein